MLINRFFFKRESKITAARQFSFLFGKAKRFNCGCLSFHVHNNELANARLGVVVAKRNQKHAVDRNRTKRIVRDSFRLNQHLLSGVDIIVVARRGINSLPTEAIRKDLECAWSKIKQC